jgi:glutathione S-transferase
MTMKLYFHPFSPNARKVRIAAELLDIPLQLQQVDLAAGEGRQPWFLALNPNGKVPVLDDGGFVLWESHAIMEYLAAKRPGNTLLPQELRLRMEVLRWQCWALAHWLPAVQTLVFEKLFKPMLGQGAPDTEEIRKAEESLHRLAQVLDGALARRQWLAGEGLTFADLGVGTHLMYAKPAQLPLDGYIHIQRWFAQLEALPAWQATAAPQRPAEARHGA